MVLQIKEKFEISEAKLILKKYVKFLNNGKKNRKEKNLNYV